MRPLRAWKMCDRAVQLEQLQCCKAMWPHRTLLLLIATVALVVERAKCRTENVEDDSAEYGETYDRATLRTVSLIYSKATNGRMILLLCRQPCITQRVQIPQWIREFSERRNISSAQKQIGYHFHIIRRKFPFFDVASLPPEEFPHIVYIIGGRSFHFNGNIDSKSDFIEFLEQHEKVATNQIVDSKQLTRVINAAQECYGNKQLLLVYDSKRCPILHFDNVVRSLRGVANYSVYELMQPLSPEMSVELFRRLEELPSICQLLVIMHNNGYTWTSADKDSQEIRAIIETLENNECSMPATGWWKIGKPLTDIEKVFLKEEDLSRKLEWKPVCIMVGATGGIAVVALAISIFWGLNGSSFATK
uniref:Potassium channel regulatory protein sup-10 n=2 Tax=Ascaris TaxID=6251 RepID=F1L4L3_ASCSU